MQPVSSDAPAYPDESSAKIPKAPCGTVKRAFRAAFPPHAADSGGLSLPWLRVWSADAHQGLFVPLPDVHAMTIFGGSLEYVTVSMLLSAFAPLETFLMALLIQARHLFYGAVSAGQVCRGWLEEAAAHLWPVRRNLLHHLLR